MQDIPYEGDASLEFFPLALNKNNQSICLSKFLTTILGVGQLYIITSMVNQMPFTIPTPLVDYTIGAWSFVKSNHDHELIISITVGLT